MSRFLPLLIMATGFAPPRQPQKVRPKILEVPALSQRLQDCLATIPDPRRARTRLHSLPTILTIAHP
ncbi:MAG: hypothetical protein VKJ46_06030 [Leptolyngbyaceae bacterium]|nr:hypothetical protein [Leptolyngbyaceae bacterium]